MTKQELRDAIKDLANDCDDSDEQQAVKSVLFGLVAAMYANRELALMDHAAVFAQGEVRRLAASRN